MAETLRKYIPFSYKTMIPYLLLLLLTDAVIGYFSYRTALASRTELVKTNIAWTLQQMRDGVRYRMEDLQAVADSLFSSPSFQQYLEVSGGDLQVLETTTGRLLPLMETAVRMSVQHLRLIVYVSNERIGEIYSVLDGPIRDKSYHILSLNRIADAPWYRDIAATEADNVWRQVGGDRAGGQISLVRKLISFGDYQTPIGFLRLTVPMDNLFFSLQPPVGAREAVVRVLDGDSVLLQTEAQPGARTDGDGHLSIREPIPGTDFVLEALVPHGLLMKDAPQIGRITVLVCLASFLAAAAIAVVVARISGRRMKRIVAHVRSFRQGRFDSRIPLAGSDEFGQISAAFNQMARHIDELIRTVYVQGIEKKEKEMQALQAQINPHFLYNTLSSVISLAHIGETGKLSAMVEALIRFYRLTLNNGRIFIPLSGEIEQIQAYLDIQAIKYASRFSVSYDVEPGLERYTVIKLLLQPFVENVFKHAWFDERIHIRIVARTEGEDIVLQVIDNGVGLPRPVAGLPPAVRSEPAAPNGRSPSGGGYGIRNVQERIRLQYGERYGVRLYSRPGIGTNVTIRLPARECRERPERGRDHDDLPHAAGRR